MISVDEVRRLAGSVPDPELPALTIDDLGILRDVRVDSMGAVVVDITPTYSGCPALEVNCRFAVTCPACGSAHTREISHFGSTQCQAVRTCTACGETFPHFKEH